MVHSTPTGDFDVLTRADVVTLAEHAPGPCVSLFMPTHRHGPQTRQGPIRLRNLLDDADRQLRSMGAAASSVEDLLKPARVLLDDPEHWQHQSDGLALFLAPGRHWRFRVPMALPEESTVGARFRLRPLLPLLSGDGVFFVLALSQNAVRIFEATRSTIGEIDPGEMPTSMAEALAFEEPQRQLQSHSTGPSSVQFHGHGAGAEIEKAALERFLRLVDKGLQRQLGGSTHPLVLACVDYYVPVFRSVTHHPRVLKEPVEGNPEHRRPEELQAAAWELVRPLFAAASDEALARYRQAAGKGAAVDAIADVVAAARDGRVDTLLVTPGPPVWGRVDAATGTVDLGATESPGREDLVDRAVLDTIIAGGTVVAATPADLPAGVGAAALLRY